MAPEEPRRRQVEQVRLVLVDEAPALLVDGEVLVADEDRPGADRLRPAAEDVVGLGIVLRRDHRGAAALEDAGLLGGHRLDGVAEILGVVAPDRRDDGRGDRVDHVGGVHPAAEPDLEQQHVGGRLGEQEQRRGGGDLEHRDRVARVGRLAAREGVGQPVFRHEGAPAHGAEPDALVEAHEMG